MNETKNVSKRTRNPIFFRKDGKGHEGHGDRFEVNPRSWTG